jgi:hypothetical protein
MNIFKLKQYIKYRSKALGRHGLHSPFAYAFVEDLLHETRSKADLLPNITTYYSIKNFFLSENDGLVNKSVSRAKKNFKKSAFSFDQLVVFPEGGLEAAAQYLSKAKADDIVLVKGLHNSAATEALWQQLQSDPRVTLSMDLFDAGLLFFRREFKVKQHFLLR